MSDIICVTNRKLCSSDFLGRIKEIAACQPAGIILREKDLSEAEYTLLADKVLNICAQYNVQCILHSFIKAARQLKCEAVHLPIIRLSGLSDEERAGIKIIGASCHSAAEACLAEKLGCDYITAGHIFDTDCKKGMPGRGVDFLKEVCTAVKLPVYAIGGIGAENITEIKKAGAAGACLMSGLMQCEDPAEYLAAFER